LPFAAYCGSELNGFLYLAIMFSPSRPDIFDAVVLAVVFRMSKY
jgi:hypothetical protein